MTNTKLVDKEMLPPITAKTEKQKELFAALHSDDAVIVVRGPAGTGKTYCTAGDAADELLRNHIARIVISRPYVGMGEKMGFRPGTEQEKLMPFMLPIIDVLKKRMGKGAFDTNLQNGNIELVPLETLRGRSFEDAIVIVDEAQNTTPKEMRSIVTRIGENCQLILMGDPKQKDIEGDSGLDWVCDLIRSHSIPNTSIIDFSIDDCVRSDICGHFLRALDKDSFITY